MSETSPLFHLALRLDGRRCLVVGGGPVAARKAAALIECGALVTVVAPEISAQLEKLDVAIERRRYHSLDLEGCRLVVAATGVKEVDASVYEDATRAGVLVNAADDPDSCEFMMPAVTRMGPISVAVSTGGTSPYLAGWVKRRVAAMLTPQVAELAAVLAKTRSTARAAGVSTESLDWDGLVESQLWPLLCEGRHDEAATAASVWLSSEVAAPE